MVAMLLARAPHAQAAVASTHARAPAPGSGLVFAKIQLLVISRHAMESCAASPSDAGVASVCPRAASRFRLPGSVRGQGPAQAARCGGGGATRNIRPRRSRGPAERRGLGSRGQRVQLRMRRVRVGRAADDGFALGSGRPLRCEMLRPAPPHLLLFTTRASLLNAGWGGGGEWSFAGCEFQRARQGKKRAPKCFQIARARRRCFAAERRRWWPRWRLWCRLLLVAMTVAAVVVVVVFGWFAAG